MTDNSAYPRRCEDFQRIAAKVAAYGDERVNDYTEERGPHFVASTNAGHAVSAEITDLLNEIASLRAQLATATATLAQVEQRVRVETVEALMWQAIRPWIEADRMSPSILADRREFHRTRHLRLIGKMAPSLSPA